MTTRKELELCVTSTNKILKDVVKNMDTIILLRNCHPLYAGDYARRLLEEKSIHESEASEFTKGSSFINPIKIKFNHSVYQPNLKK